MRKLNQFESEKKLPKKCSLLEIYMDALNMA